MTRTQKDNYLRDFEEFYRIARDRPHDYTEPEIAVLYVGYRLRRE